MHGLLQGLAIRAPCPPQREGYRRGAQRRHLHAARHHLHMQLPRALQHNQELIAPHTHHRFFGAHLTHQKPAHPNERVIAHLMPVFVVVLLEVIDIHKNATPRTVAWRQARVELGEIAAIKAACERVALALFAQGVFRLLARRDVNEHPVIEHFTRLRIAHGVHGIEHGA